MHYILDGHKTKQCDDLLIWAKWFEKAERHVADDTIDGVRISTVFLGLDHQYGQGPPLLFETMVFGGPNDQDQLRYSSWDEAEKGHAEILEREKNLTTG
uniref:Uncharacterized protein n=1 Tax=viral metagenome TaxID=1070528 RepID=A0A6M3LRW0_9ZZZZ